MPWLHYSVLNLHLFLHAVLDPQLTDQDSSADRNFWPGLTPGKFLWLYPTLLALGHPPEWGEKAFLHPIPQHPASLGVKVEDRLLYLLSNASFGKSHLLGRYQAERLHYLVSHLIFTNILTLHDTYMLWMSKKNQRSLVTCLHFHSWYMNYAAGLIQSRSSDSKTYDLFKISLSLYIHSHTLLLYQS